MPYKVIFTGSRDQNLDIFGDHYATYHRNVNGSGGSGNKDGNDVTVDNSRSVGKFHVTSMNCDGEGGSAGNVDSGKSNSDVNVSVIAGLGH